MCQVEKISACEIILAYSFDKVSLFIDISVLPKIEVIIPLIEWLQSVAASGFAVAATKNLPLLANA